MLPKMLKNTIKTRKTVLKNYYPFPLVSGKCAPKKRTQKRRK